MAAILSGDVAHPTSVSEPSKAAAFLIAIPPRLRLISFGEIDSCLPIESHSGGWCFEFLTCIPLSSHFLFSFRQRRRPYRPRQSFARIDTCYASAPRCLG